MHRTTIQHSERKKRGSTGREERTRLKEKNLKTSARTKILNHINSRHKQPQILGGAYKRKWGGRNLGGSNTSGKKE